MIFKNKSNFVLALGLIAGFAFWVFDGTVDAFFFQKNKTVLENIFSSDAHEIYMRVIVLILFLIVAFITRILLKQQEKINFDLEQHKNNLESLVATRTDELEKLATIDDLTQIYNRRKLYELTGFEIERSLRYKHPLSVIMIDIDHFKKINDNYGHDIGDQALQILTSTISNLIRAADIFGRIGGEEFVLILPDTDMKSAKEFAERIRLCIENEKFPAVNHITISLGVTQCIEKDKVHPLFKRADTALYTAKNNGRNRVASS